MWQRLRAPLYVLPTDHDKILIEERQIERSAAPNFFATAIVGGVRLPQT